MPTTTARNYFEQYTGTDAVALLQSLPGANPKVFENEWLDFKSGKAVSDPANLEKIWSKAVGAFANNEGGVLIFGIDARLDASNGIDAAGAVEPVADVNWLVSKLTDFSRFATDPPPTGVEYKALSINGAEGFVVCLIPEGKEKPYRSERDGKRFYLRMGDSAKEPTVSMLRMLFYPTTKHRAKLTIEPLNLGDILPFLQIASSHSAFYCKLGITNMGFRTLEDWALSAKSIHGTIQEVQFLDPIVPSIGPLSNVHSFNDSLHPGISGHIRLLLTFPRSTGPGGLALNITGKDMVPLTALINGTDFDFTQVTRHIFRVEDVTLEDLTEQ